MEYPYIKKLGDVIVIVAYESDSNATATVYNFVTELTLGRIESLSNPEDMTQLLDILAEHEVLGRRRQ